MIPPSVILHDLCASVVVILNLSKDYYGEAENTRENSDHFGIPLRDAENGKIQPVNSTYTGRTFFFNL